LTTQTQTVELRVACSMYSCHLGTRITAKDRNNMNTSNNIIQLYLLLIKHWCRTLCLILYH